MSIKKIFFILKPLDFLIIFLFFVTIVTFFDMIFTGNSKLIAEISCNNDIYEYDLSQNGEFNINGILGQTKICIQNNEIFIKDSPCKNKLCVHQGRISKDGQWLCCAPNQVIVIIKGKKISNQNNTDAISF